MYSTTNSRVLSSMSRLWILARSENITLIAKGSLSVARNALNVLRDSAAAFGASRECDGIPPALRFTGPLDPLLYTDRAVIKVKSS